jgi:acetyl esterase/lipase
MLKIRTAGATACRFCLAALVAIASLAGMAGAAHGNVRSPNSLVAGEAVAQDQEVSFTSGPDTLYGSLLVPPATPGQRPPAALIIAGSGPTDRNGNNPLISGPVDTLQNFARALAAAGVVSLRYDKLGTGETGLASYTPDTIGSATFNTLVDEAQAAYAFLASQPQVDPSRIMILGHSEGGLIALILANRLQADQAPAGLVLAAPLGLRFLDTVRHQLGDQVAAAEAAGQLSTDVGDTLLADLDRAIASVRQTGALPSDLGATFQKLTGGIFAPATLSAVQQEDSYDPQALAASLPASLPVLILRGDKEQQVGAGDVQNLLQGFSAAGNTGVTSVELAGVDHVFKEVPGEPNPAVDYGNPALSFSQGAVGQLDQFVSTYLQAGG